MMRVILRADIAGLGKRGDICEVKDGYGRNYLLPRSLALVATDGGESLAALPTVCFAREQQQY